MHTYQTMTRHHPTSDAANIGIFLETCSIVSRFIRFGGKKNKKSAIMQVLFSPYQRFLTQIGYHFAVSKTNRP